MGACQKVRQMTFKHRLVTARDQARGVSTEIGKLDDKPGKSRTGPSRRIRPDGEIVKKLVDDALGRAGEAFAKCAEGRKSQSMLRFEHFGEKQVLACKMIVQRPLRDGSGCRDLIHAHTHESLAAEQTVGGIENGLACRRRGSRHLSPIFCGMYTG